MKRRLISIAAVCGLVVFWSTTGFAQEKATKEVKTSDKMEQDKGNPQTPPKQPDAPPTDASKPPEATQPAAAPENPAAAPAAKAQESSPSADEAGAAEEGSEMGAESAGETAVAPAAEVPKEPKVRWPYQEPLFALSAQPKSRVRLGAGFATSPDTNSLGLFLEGSYSFSRFGIRIQIPVGLAMADQTGSAFNYGDIQFGAQWLIAYEEETNKHLMVGLDFIAPTSRMGEKSNSAGVQSGTLTDDSNFGKRYLLAQKPFLDMGLIPKLNVGLVPYVAFGQNLGRVSLQTDFGCLILMMDNVKETVYGTDRRYGFILFYDLAAPVAITQELSLVAEFNAAVALDGLLGTGFAITLGPRYRVSSFSAGLGIQLPLGVDNNPPDDDKMLGRYDSTIVGRHQLAALLDLSYSF